MVGFHLLLFLLPIMGLTVAGQEVAKLLNLHEPTRHLILQSLPHSTSPPPIAVSVGEADLPAVSSSVVLAESWLRSHVLAHFPSTNITTIVVGKGVLCSMKDESKWGLVLPSVKNLFYTLVRWGLVREIKVSVAFSSECLGHHSSSSPRFRGDLAESLLKPLLSFLQDNNSTYSINPPLYPSSSSSENANLVFSAHMAALERVGFSQLKDIRLIKEEKPISRKLTSFTSSLYPEKPKPIGFPVPANVAVNPIPPSPQFALAPDGSFSFVPDASPSEVPANPPDEFSTPPPPCLAAPPLAPVPAAVPPGAGVEEKGGLWCVAKPTVPAETLQEAMDYACGEGGADCEEIKPLGSCYYPDTAVAHASFAFNSYWQKTKGTGGSCNFGGTAILINSDPSFLHCRFVLS